MTREPFRPMHARDMTERDRARFWAKVDRGEADGCWLWIAAMNQAGYGHMRWRGTTWSAHRWSYVLHNETISPELVVDHLCRNPPCVNPAHLEAVTHEENIRRGENHYANVTHCPSGHPYDDANTLRYVRKDDGLWRRECRSCGRAKMRRLRSSPEGRARLAASVEERRQYQAEYKQRPDVIQRRNDRAQAKRDAETPEERAARQALAREYYRRQQERKRAG